MNFALEKLHKKYYYNKAPKKLEVISMRISFIGAGNMATAIINSIINSKRVLSQDVFVFDKFGDKSKMLSDTLKVNCCRSLSDAVNSADTIVLAVKPQDYEALLIDIKSCTDNISKKMFVSIAAAISCDYICKTLECECAVVRVMPNTPIMLGVGATAISRNKLVSDKEYSKICTIFASSGCVVSLYEDLMNNVISVNSSSPVYLYMLAKAMIDGAVKQDISEKAATELVYQTLKGSCEMLIKSGKTPDELIKMVASPRGTTLAAISSLENDDFYNVIDKAMKACTNRANELSR